MRGGRTVNFDLELAEVDDAVGLSPEARPAGGCKRTILDFKERLAIQANPEAPSVKAHA